jgi:hypothetical protein
MDGKSETSEVIDDFKMALTEWIEIQENISSVQKVLKDKRNRQKKLGEFVIAYMTKEDKEICQIGEGDMVMIKKRKTTESLKRPHVEAILKDILKDEDMAKESTERIFNSRVQKETPILKLSK